MKQSKKITNSIGILVMGYIVLSAGIYFISGYRQLRIGVKFDGFVSHIKSFRYEANGEPLTLEEIMSHKDFTNDIIYCPITSKHYIYRGSDVSSDMPKELVIACGNEYELSNIEKISFINLLIAKKKYRLVAFNNFEVKVLPKKKFDNAIERDNQLRKKLGLEIKTDG
jgi:hypothetical protein